MNSDDLREKEGNIIEVCSVNITECNYYTMHPPPRCHGACDTNLSMDCHNITKLKATQMQRNVKKTNAKDAKNERLFGVEKNAKKMQLQAPHPPSHTHTQR